MMRWWLLPAAFMFLYSCSGLRSAGSFQVIPQSPNYMLRSPEAHETLFSDVLRAYNGFQPGQGSLDLRPLMELRIENAYYQAGASRRGLTGYLGTEVARYEVLPQGLHLLTAQAMPHRPTDQAPVQKLIPLRAQQFPHYRFYYEILFAQRQGTRGSVLLGADSPEELNQLSFQLAQPETVCYSASIHCTVFPEVCSVAVEIKVTINGQSQTVGWGSVLAGIADHPQHLQLKRLHAGRLIPVRLNPHDPNVLRLPLLPGDQIVWN